MTTPVALAKPTPEVDVESISQRYASRVHSRYRDAYRVARAIVQVGWVIKMLAILIGILAVILIVLSTYNVSGDGPFSRSRGSHMRGRSWDLPSGTVGAVVVGIPSLLITMVISVLGLLISAQGQILKASLDGAVHSSPFLSDQQRAKVMSLG